MPAAPVHERPTLQEQGQINFWHYGFFTRPLSNDSRARSGVDPEPWMELESLITRLKSGEFAAVPELLAFARGTRNEQLHGAACRTLGYTASVECFREMRSELEAHRARVKGAVTVDDRFLYNHYCDAFHRWGRLDVVPVLLDQYLTLRLAGLHEVSGANLAIDEMIVAEGDSTSMIGLDPPESDLENYLNLVMDRYEKVVEVLGGDTMHVFRAEPISIHALAENIRHLRSKSESNELASLRAIFEPYTGLDCSDFFEQTGGRPLSAAVIAERFLASAQANRYEGGPRYFFGHRVPD